MTETIVVGVDGSDASKAALGWAASLAELTGATIVAVHSWGPIYPVGVDPEQGARTHITRVLEEVLGADRAEATRLVVSPDAPGHLLVHEAADADLLVVGSHGRGHGALTGALLGSVSEYCLHHSKCSVAVIRTAEHVD